MIFILEMRKLKFRKVVTCHSASNWQCQYVTSNLPASEALHFWHLVLFQSFQRTVMFPCRSSTPVPIVYCHLTICSQTYLKLISMRNTPKKGCQVALKKSVVLNLLVSSSNYSNSNLILKSNQMCLTWFIFMNLRCLTPIKFHFSKCNAEQSL